MAAEPTAEERPHEIPAGEAEDEPSLEVMSVDLNAPAELPAGDTAQGDDGESEEASLPQTPAHDLKAPPDKVQ